MKTQKNDNKGTDNNKEQFQNVNHRCLIEGQAHFKCDHWGCKVTAKSPQYYQGWAVFFANLGIDRFRFTKSTITAQVIQLLPDEIRVNVPSDILNRKGYLRGIKKGCDKPNNSGFEVETRGYWPERSFFNFDEIKFIHVEYNQVNSILVSNNTVKDVKEVAIYVGKKGGCNNG